MQQPYQTAARAVSQISHRSLQQSSSQVSRALPLLIVLAKAALAIIHHERLQEALALCNERMLIDGQVTSGLKSGRLQWLEATGLRK